MNIHQQDRRIVFYYLERKGEQFGLKRKSPEMDVFIAECFKLYYGGNILINLPVSPRHIGINIRQQKRI